MYYQCTLKFFSLFKPLYFIHSPPLAPILYEILKKLVFQTSFFCVIVILNEVKNLRLTNIVEISRLRFAPLEMTIDRELGGADNKSYFFLLFTISKLPLTTIISAVSLSEISPLIILSASLFSSWVLSKRFKGLAP